MGSFKIGQWVRVTDDAGCGAAKGRIGDVGKVLHVSYDDLTTVELADGVTVYQYAYRFEPWRPKVGERVREREPKKLDYVNHWNTFWKSEEGPLDGDSFFVTKVNGDWIHYSNRAGGKGPRTTVNSIEPLSVAEQPPLKIEAGKYYRTRDGRKVGPMEKVSDFWTAGSGANGTPGHFTNEGVSALLGILPREESRAQHDLVAEWVDEPAVAVAASNDNAAPAKPKFKVGDRVRVDDASERCHDMDGTVRHIHHDGDYLVEFNGWGGGHDGSLSGRSFKGDNCWWLEPKQVVASAGSANPAIVCLIENGQPKPAARPFVHPDQAAAERESKRLAGIHKGKEFGVYVLASTAKEERTYDHEWQRLAAKGEKIAAIKELRSVASLDLVTAKQAVERFVDKAA